MESTVFRFPEVGRAMLTLHKSVFRVWQKESPDQIEKRSILAFLIV